MWQAGSIITVSQLRSAAIITPPFGRSVGSAGVFVDDNDDDDDDCVMTQMRMPPEHMTSLCLVDEALQSPRAIMSFGRIFAG